MVANSEGAELSDYCSIQAVHNQYAVSAVILHGQSLTKIEKESSPQYIRPILADKTSILLCR